MENFLEAEVNRLKALVLVQEAALKAPASEIRFAFALGFRHGCGADVSDELDLLRKLSDAWKLDGPKIGSNSSGLGRVEGGKDGE